MCLVSKGHEGGQSGTQVARPHRHHPSGLVGMQEALQSEERLGTRLHLHDDGFLGDFSLLLSDYKENSRNSKGYVQMGQRSGLSSLSGMDVITCSASSTASKPCPTVCPQADWLSLDPWFPHV